MEIVIIQECSAGNESVGHMWLETTICTEKTTIKEILDWQTTLPSGAGGRLIITKPKQLDDNQKF